MNSRFEEIDLFLKQVAKIYATNSYIDIYALLEMYDFSEKELNDYDTSIFFENWQKHFKSKKHIRTGFRMNGFLSFNSQNFNDYSCVKLYLSFPKEHLEEAVIQIFDFIDNKKILTSSKVAAHLRSDEVVLRVPTISDANLIIEYLNNNRKLSSWMKKTNPFVPRIGPIGIAYDEDLSYNSVMEEIICEYLSLRKSENALSKVNYSDFASYVNKYYNQTFKSIEGIKKLQNNSSFQKNYHRISQYNHRYTEGKLVLNYKKVCAMLIQSLDYQKTEDSHLRTILGFQNKDNDYQMSSYYDTIIDIEKQRKNLETLKNILDDYIMYLENNNMNAKMILNAFVNQGDYNLITRVNSYRSLFYYNNMLGAIPTLTNNNIDMYVNNIISANNVSNENVSTIISVEDIKRVVDEYIEYGLTKYGAYIVCNQLNKFLLNGDYNLITRDYKLRDKFISYQLDRNIHQVFFDRIDDYVQQFSSHNIQNHEDELIKKNHAKKELLDEYIRYAIENYGIETTCLQLKSFMINGNYMLITSSYNLRQRFEEEQMDIYIGGIVQLDIEKYIYNNFNINISENVGHIRK